MAGRGDSEVLARTQSHDVLSEKLGPLGFNEQRETVFRIQCAQTNEGGKNPSTFLLNKGGRGDFAKTLNLQGRKKLTYTKNEIQLFKRTSPIRSFSVEDAIKYGTFEAIVLEELYYQFSVVDVNHESIRIFDGSVFVPFGQSAIQEVIGCMSLKQVRMAISSLRDQRLIRTLIPDPKRPIMYFSLVRR